jgi:anthranilate synthase component I
LESLYSAAVSSTQQIATRLKADKGLSAERSQAVHFEANQTREQFERRVDAVKELIKAGECYQAVISQRFSALTDADAIAIYRALRMSNPSPYMFVLRMGERSLIGASPEMLVRCRGTKLEYRPIAGTRPRGADEQQDDQLALDLLADEKERAEHTMLVDLGRNDLGRVAKIGSIKVKDFMRVEKFSHVQHLVTDLIAELRDGSDCFDALASCFPAGTVTGAPKIRAMQAIAEIEPDARGVYSGTVFYADHAGNLDSCIAIRTIELHDGFARVQAGAGIVADSDPGKEYEETINKARALQHAVATAGSVA